MRIIAELINEDDDRRAIIWRSGKAGVFVVNYCDERGANWNDAVFGWHTENTNEEATALYQALNFAAVKAEVMLKNA
jgi:hypothetical protein